jgi:hypothetical protein
MMSQTVTSNVAAAPRPAALVKMPEFLRRAFQVDQMEVDSAMSQIWNCLVNPALVYKMSKARKMTKDHYHRDDPAFMVLQLVFLAATTIAFGLALHARPFRLVYNVVYELGVGYVALGSFIATGEWFLVNRFLMSPGVLPHEVKRDVEWQFCLDIHCNAYVSYFCWTQVAHFALLPLVLHNTFLARLVANTIFAAGASSYLYMTFRGLLEIPTLHRQQIVLYPVLGVAVLLVLGTLFTGVNMSHVTLSYTWPRYD